MPRSIYETNYLMTSDIRLTPRQVIEAYARRWRFARAYLAWIRARASGRCRRRNTPLW